MGQTAGSHTDILLPHRQYRQTNRWHINQSINQACPVLRLTALRSATSLCVARLSAPQSTGVLMPGRRPNMMLALARTFAPPAPSPTAQTHSHSYGDTTPGPPLPINAMADGKTGRPPSPRLRQQVYSADFSTHAWHKLQCAAVAPRVPLHFSARPRSTQHNEKHNGEWHTLSPQLPCV